MSYKIYYTINKLIKENYYQFTTIMRKVVVEIITNRNIHSNLSVQIFIINGHIALVI